MEVILSSLLLTSNRGLKNILEYYFPPEKYLKNKKTTKPNKKTTKERQVFYLSRKANRLL